MDKKLLDSLNNLSVALESIADILNKKQTKSATGAALESGDFSKDIKQISVYSKLFFSSQIYFRDKAVQ